MKECKILHIHDGDSEVLENGNWHLLEQYPRAEKTLNDLLSQGYEVKQMMPKSLRLCRRLETGLFINQVSLYIWKERSPIMSMDIVAKIP